MVYIFIKMVQNMKDNGKMIFNMDMELKAGQMDQNMKEIINMEKKMEKV
jgi:hypothetical protein